VIPDTIQISAAEGVPTWIESVRNFLNTRDYYIGR